MPRSKDATKPMKKVRLTYCIATPRESKAKKGMNASRNWGNKSLNKSRVLMRSIRANNAALAKKLNEVQIEVAKYEEETSRLRDCLQITQQDNRAREACLKDIFIYYDEIAQLIVALGKRVNDGLNASSRVNMSSSSYLNKSMPLNTTVSLNDVEQPMRPTESQLQENPFVRRDKIPRTPPLVVSSFVEEEGMETNREQLRKSGRLEASPWGRKDPRREKLEVGKPRKRRSERDNQFVGIKQVSMISESPRALDKSLEKKEQPSRSHPDVIVEKMLNDLMSHGMPGSMEEDTPSFPPSPCIASRTPVEKRRPRSHELSRRLSIRKSSSPRIETTMPYQEAKLIVPATPRMVPEPGLNVAQTSRASPFYVVSELTSKSQPIVVDKEQSVVSKSTKKKRTNTTKPKKRIDKRIRQEPEPVSEVVVKLTVNDQPKAVEMPQQSKNETDDNIISGASSSTEKTNEAQPEVSDTAAAGRTVMVESKKPGVLKFSAPKPGEENAKATKGKKSKKKSTRPTAKTKQVKQIGKETKTEKPKSVFDFSMSDTMNETTKALPPFSEFREKNNEQTFVKPDVPIAKTTVPDGPMAKTTKSDVPIAKTTKPDGQTAKTTKSDVPMAKTTKPDGPTAKTTKSDVLVDKTTKSDVPMVKAMKVVVDKIKPMNQSNDHPEGEKKADPSPAKQKTRSTRQKKVREVGKSKPSAQPLQEVQPKADESHNDSMNLNVERVDVSAEMHTNLNEEPQPSIDDEFQTKKPSIKKSKRRFARLITFDDSVEENEASDPKQARLEPLLPQTPMIENRDTENNSRATPDSTRSRRGNQINYKEPGMNKKLRRGDPHWCRKNL